MEPAAGPLLLLCLSFLFSVLSSFSDGIPVVNGGVISVGNPVITITPPSASSCERVQVVGVSRLRLGSIANAYKVSLVPSVSIHERYHNRIQICFHGNASLGLCQCENNEWKTVDKGLWSSLMSPYDSKYLDLKFDGDIYGSVTLTVDEEFQRWRLFCFALGFGMLLVAPGFSKWVPFYYSSSMAIGILLVILILLFQAMKLLPTGRKSALYLTLYGSMITAGSYLLHQLSSLVNSFLVNLGLTEEMHNLVYVFVLVGIVLAGAALGYWIVRKFVISDDGMVDDGVAQFMKWAMRFIAFISILQTSMDAPLGIGLFASSYALCYIIHSFPWTSPDEYRTSQDQEYSPGYGNIWNLSRERATYPKQRRTEFLSRSANMSSRWSTPRKSAGRFETPTKVLTSSRSPRSSGGRTNVDTRSYFSTFHKTPNRKKFTKREWEEFTKESTQQAVNELTASPAFTDWVIKNANRIKLLPEDTSESSAGSESGSTDETMVEGEMRNDGLSLFNWR